MSTAEPSPDRCDTCRGLLHYASNGEDDSLLAIGESIIAERIQEKIEEFGPYLTVRYWTAAVEMTSADIRAEALREILGFGDAKYGARYSEETGYLWTDEECRVGGHNLIAELTSHIGRFCELEIRYNREATTAPSGAV